MDDKDKRLLSLLTQNARASTTNLARKMGLSRSTVQDRIARLEHNGIISGYTVKLSEGFEQRLIKTNVMISVRAKRQAEVVVALKKMEAVQSLYAISGEFDLIAILSAATTEDIDKALDAIGEIDGIERTHSSVILSTKFER